MTQAIVQRLEVVDVDQDHRERFPYAIDPLDLARQVILEEPVVVQLRQAVGDRELFQDLIGPL